MKSGLGTVERNALLLKDLSRQSCAWRSGSRFTGMLPFYGHILQTLELVNPIYKKIMELAAANVNFCLSDQPLIQLGYEDSDAVTIFEDNALQIAIRVGAEVYIDQRQFERMDEVNRAFLVFHELLHPFVPTGTSRRNAKL